MDTGDRCAWCGALFDADAQRLRGRIRCGRCGVATTHPWPTESELEAAYGRWYRPAAGRFSGPGDRLLRLTRGALARRIDSLAPAGSVLDVGAGDGTLVRALQARGRDAVGLERGDPDLPGPFAAVVFWHSLEHLRAPAAALAAAAERLAPGGLMAIAIPNADSLQARAFGDRWLALDLPRHLTHVPARALRAKLRELGLEPVRESHLRGGQVAFGWLHGLVGALTGVGLYDAIRRADARSTPIPGGRRALALAAALPLAPVAAALAGVEAVLRRGGTVYIEARLPPSRTA